MSDRRSFLKCSAGPLGVFAAGLPAAGAAAPASRRVRATTLDTPAGPLRGRVVDDTQVFKGAPYVRPPVGALRFKPAVPLGPHHTVFDAFDFAPGPMQPPFPVAVASTTLLGDARGLPEWSRYSADRARSRETMILNDRSEVVRDPAGNERALWDGVL
jgi:carboxylesterase type B